MSTKREKEYYCLKQKEKKIYRHKNMSWHCAIKEEKLKRLDVKKTFGFSRK